MTYAEKKRLRVAAMESEQEDAADFVKEDNIARLREAFCKVNGIPFNRLEEVINSIERIHSRREALLKASSIARSMLSKTKPGEEAYRLRKAAEEMKHEADRMGEKMVAVWMDGEAG